VSHLPYAASEEFSPDDDLAALGLDSIGMMHLLVDLEEAFGLELPDEVITEETLATVGSLWQMVSGLIAAELPVDA
jgi:acyl carrier protein